MQVLDLSCDVAGRFAAKLFAWGGGRVVRCAPDLGEPESLALYLDGGKERADAAELAALVAASDLIFTSFDAGRMLGHAKDLAVPPGAVHVTTSSYGTTGPYAQWRGGSLADWAAGGYLYITGDPDREPLSGPENLCAYAAGYTAAAGAEAALIDRIRTGRGRRVDISTMESMLLLHQSTFARTAAGELRRRTGRYTEVYPLTVLPCRDGHVSLGVVTDSEYDKFCIAIGRPELSADPRYADKPARWANRDQFDREIAPFLLAHDADDLVALLQQGGVACAKVAGPRDIADNPQLAHRGYWEETEGGGVMPGYPLRHFHAFEGAESRASGFNYSSPLAGEDTKAWPRSGLAAVGEGGGRTPPSPSCASGPARKLRFPPPQGGRSECAIALPLAGIRVLDFTIFWAGPSAARTMADLGAEVIWVERPGSRLDTDLAPGQPAAPADVMQHLYATKMYRGKQSMLLDLEQPQDLALAHALAREAHVVIENFRPGVADKLGIGPAELGRINPGLTYVSLSGWGASGPWAQWRSYGPSIEAASSIEGRTGYRGGAPLRLGHALPDATGGLVGALAALRGLRQRLGGGPGGWFDISQLETYLTLCGEGVIEATRHGRGLEMVGNRSRFGALQGVFPCRGEDQWVALRLTGEADIASFAEASGIGVVVLSEPDQAEPAIAKFTRGQDKSDLAARLQAAGLEAFPVLDARELATDPHLKARGYFLAVQAGDRICAVPGTPLVAEPRMADATRPAPRPDQHGAQIRARTKVGETAR